MTVLYTNGTGIFTGGAVLVTDGTVLVTSGNVLVTDGTVLSNDGTFRDPYNEAIFDIRPKRRKKSMLESGIPDMIFFLLNKGL